MNDSNDFTPRELFIISLYKDPARMFKNSALRTLCVVALSLVCAVVAAVQQDIGMAVLAYFLLLLYTVSRIILLKRGLGTMKSIILKYEAKLQSKTP